MTGKYRASESEFGLPHFLEIDRTLFEAVQLVHVNQGIASAGKTLALTLGVCVIHRLCFFTFAVIPFLFSFFSSHIPKVNLRHASLENVVMHVTHAPHTCIQVSHARRQVLKGHLKKQIRHTSWGFKGASSGEHFVGNLPIDFFCITYLSSQFSWSCSSTLDTFQVVLRWMRVRDGRDGKGSLFLLRVK